MIPREDLVELVGHEAGGVCPFGVNDGVTIYLDESLKNMNLYIRRVEAQIVL